MRRLVFATALLMCATTAAAQLTEGPAFEIRPYVGVSVPTGDQRDLFEDAALLGAQFAVQVKRDFHLVGSFGWIPGESKYAVRNQNVSILQYDVGAEVALVRPMGRWEWKPFLGAGGGARTYLYHGRLLDDKTCFAGYGSLGMEFQLGRTAARMEARDNVFCFKSPIDGVASKTRNEIGLSLGVAFHFQ
ncbi:MAG TPA: hypothetical protein VJ803_10105 [Gemmatimonadaceae bacterium]|jgi:hypothetical protein|nr:hypothetical protein [Gemmatimonadaceae bacterium]